MRILIATDGSEHGNRAVALVAAQPWPDGTELQVLVADDGRLLTSKLLADSPVVTAVGSTRRDLDDIAHLAVRILDRPGWMVSWEVVPGRAATVIVDAAARYEADVIVVGSRGHGFLGSLTLGSVSAEVVDHADRPVLVGRGEMSFERVVLADDGSNHAGAARRMVVDWPVFRGSTITVTSVAHVPAPLHSAIAPTNYRAALADYTQSLLQARAQRDQILADAAAELEAAGRSVVTIADEGDPADRILTVAELEGAQLIVMGSRGQTGLTRLLLGSVARTVLYQASCSVLITAKSS